MNRSNKISKRICELRKKSGLSIRAAAEGISVSESTYRSWEYGSAIRGEPYEAIAKLYGVSLTYLLSGDDQAVERLVTRVLKVQDELKKLQTEIEMSLLK